MRSKNKIMLLTGVIKFLERHADLLGHEIRIKHHLKPAAAYSVRHDHTVLTSIQLVKTSLFKPVVWSVSLYRGFNDYLELPDELCNELTQGKLAREKKEQEAKDAQQVCQASLLYEGSGA